MLENVEVFVDWQGTICIVLPADDSGHPPVVLECVDLDDAFAPQE